MWLSVNPLLSLIVACIGGRPATTLSIECGAAPIALDIHLENSRVVDQTVDGGEGHDLAWKYLAPFAEGLIGGDQHRVSFGVEKWLWRRFDADQIAPIKRAWRRSIFARPYIWRLTSLSLVI